MLSNRQIEDLKYLESIGKYGKIKGKKRQIQFSIISLMYINNNIINLDKK